MFDVGRGFLASAARSPNALAISDGAQQWTYRQWRDEVTRVACGLQNIGLVQDDHLVSVLQNRQEAATLHMACQLTGIVITPVNWRTTADQLNYVLADCDAVALVYDNAARPVVEQTQAKADRTHIDLDDPSPTSCWRQLLNTAPHPIAPIDANATSVMLYTSGTTGRGKGVPRSHAAERAAAIAHVAQNQYGWHEVTLGVMPLYHTMGVRSLLASILMNGHFVCQRRFDPLEALALIERFQITNLYLV
ncbi:MAG: AMP-binding protein, partial [Chromatiales bacterium]|nr:AMP-binding protein [Chromatiales bacterium]